MPSIPPKTKSHQGDDISREIHANDWFSRLARLDSHFGRFLWDILGVILLSFAMMTLLGIFGLSKCTLLEKWVFLLDNWAGWGKYLIVFMIRAGSILTFRRSRNTVIVRWGQIIAFELA